MYSTKDWFVVLVEYLHGQVLHFLFNKKCQCCDRQANYGIFKIPPIPKTYFPIEKD